MSHVTEVKTEIRDKETLLATLSELSEVEWHQEGTFKSYQGNMKGYGVKLKSWKYPIVVDFNTGTVEFDNYNGDWGNTKELDKLRQGYAKNKTLKELRRLGHRVTAQHVLEDGSIKVVVQSGGSSW